MESHLFELEVCLIHEEDNSGSTRTKNADLTKLKSGWAFTSDFNPHVLPAMPKLAIQQVIMPHNPGHHHIDTSADQIGHLQATIKSSQLDNQQDTDLHNPLQDLCDESVESVGSISANSTPRSCGFYENHGDPSFCSEGC